MARVLEPIEDEAFWTKRCSQCQEEKPLSEFKKATRNLDGTQSICLVCYRQYYHRNKEYYLATARRSHFKNKFGMTVEEYEEKSLAQDHLCAICHLPCITGRRLAVDHDHTTGQNRDLLCQNCNTALGSMQDSIPLLEAAIFYLRRWHVHR